MNQSEIDKMIVENGNLKEALHEIAQFDAAAKHGYIDEWEEARAFMDCQNIAYIALEQVGFYKKKNS